MWIKRCITRSPMSALRPGSSPAHHIWILLAVAHLAVDLSACSPLSPAPGLKLQHKAAPRSRPHWQPLWDTPNMLHWRTVSPLARRLLSPVSPPHDGRAGLGSKVRVQRHRKPLRRLGPAECKDCDWIYSQAADSPVPLGGAAVAAAAAAVALSRGGKRDNVRLSPRMRRQLMWESPDNVPEGWTTTQAGFIDWGPTGPPVDTPDEEGKPGPNLTLSTKALSTTTVASTTTSSTTKVPIWTSPVATTTQSKKQNTTKAAVSLGDTKPPKPYGETPGLAVHQIITITVSLIMVIAALITTLVLKNCCAQSGTGRHNSHQRKIHQQEESCQNLTDFTPARVPSKVDIFTAYNESMQCSHECMRTAVPIYTDEMIQQTPVYKSSYNGNRPSPSERQLIPVAFVSEKWFEISC
ncbi:adherens junction-associated protein 1 [Gadus chalcogrammus]|uniref:adherens junction-associated protein 1 n=1 Tax=Gadus chalcogrammus TaxID=1042646 RepID=UPI0024C2AA8D|nr:adherens junction-associated protein 1 [Gadus chalcogrammus]